MINLLFQYASVFQDPVNATTFLQQLAWINNLTDVGSGGVLGIIILLLIFGALFFMMKAFSYDRALIVSTFITSFVGILLAILGLLNAAEIYICIAGVIISIINLIKESGQYEV